MSHLENLKTNILGKKFRSENIILANPFNNIKKKYKEKTLSPGNKRSCHRSDVRALIPSKVENK